MQSASTWRYRFVAPTTSFPLLLLLRVEKPSNLKDDCRQAVASALLDKELCCLKAHLHDDSTWKLRELFGNEFEVCRNTGQCPHSLYGFLLIFQASLPDNAQDSEGMNSVLQILVNRARNTRLPGADAVMSLKFGEKVSAPQCASQDSEVSRVMATDDYINRFSDVAAGLGPDVPTLRDRMLCPHNKSAGRVLAATLALGWYRNLPDQLSPCQYVSIIGGFMDHGGRDNLRLRLVGIPAWYDHWTYYSKSFCAKVNISDGGRFSVQRPFIIQDVFDVLQESTLVQTIIGDGSFEEHAPAPEHPRKRRAKLKHMLILRGRIKWNTLGEGSLDYGSFEEIKIVANKPRKSRKTGHAATAHGVGEPAPLPDIDMAPEPDVYDLRGDLEVILSGEYCGPSSDSDREAGGEIAVAE